MYNYLYVDIDDEEAYKNFCKNNDHVCQIKVDGVDHVYLLVNMPFNDLLKGSRFVVLYSIDDVLETAFNTRYFKKIYKIK